MNAVTVRVPAKVNLQLGVGPLRDDGYHDLVNVFHAVSLFDEVTVEPAGSLEVRVQAAPHSRVPVGGVPAAPATSPPARRASSPPARRPAGRPA